MMTELTTESDRNLMSEIYTNLSDHPSTSDA